MVHDPDRLLINFEGSPLRVTGALPRRIAVREGCVNEIWVGPSLSKSIQVVMDLQRPVDYKISRVSAPGQLTIDIHPRFTALAKSTDKSALTLRSVAPSAGAQSSSVRSTALDRDRNLSLTRALGLKITRVVIDPGHGGSDVGATGASGVREKDVALDVAQRLGALLQEKFGTHVTYTRVDDANVSLEERTATANRSKADLFLSIHANASSYAEAQGPETYFLRLPDSNSDLKVAARENATNSRAAYEHPALISKIAFQAKIEESREFAGLLQTALYGAESRSGSVTANRGLKHAPFVVLMGAEMPSALAEIGFLTNPSEEALLGTPEYRQTIAEGLLEGISNYIESRVQMDVARAKGEVPHKTVANH